MKKKSFVMICVLLPMCGLYAMDSLVLSGVEDIPVLPGVEDIPEEVRNADPLNTVGLLNRAKEQDRDGNANDREVVEVSNGLVAKWREKTQAEVNEVAVLLAKRDNLERTANALAELQNELAELEGIEQITQLQAENLHKKLQEAERLQRAESDSSIDESVLVGVSGGPSITQRIQKDDDEVNAVVGGNIEVEREKIEAIKASIEEAKRVKMERLAQLQELLATKQTETEEAAATVEKIQESIRAITKNACEHDRVYREKAGLKDFLQDVEEEEDISHLVHGNNGQAPAKTWFQRNCTIC